MCTLMASFAMFSTVFKTYLEKALQAFSLKKKFLEFLIPKFVIDTIN